VFVFNKELKNIIKMPEIVTKPKAHRKIQQFVYDQNLVNDNMVDFKPFPKIINIIKKRKIKLNLLMETF